MVNPPEPSASPGQEKSKHCDSKVPDVPIGDVASSMVTRSQISNNMGSVSTHNPTVVLKDCLASSNVATISNICDVFPTEAESNPANICEFCGKTFKGRKG